MSQPASQPPKQTEASRTRHDLRGKLNSLKLCVSALEISQADDESLEFLGYIIEAADGVVTALDEFEPHMPPDPGDK